MKKILFGFTMLLALAACKNTSDKQGGDQLVEEAPTLTFADVAGIYDSFNEDGGNESRICLLKDGTATWGMIGSLHYTEYTYTIKGSTICLKVNDVDTEEECYDYDPEKKSLSNEQGALYLYQDID